MKKSTSQTTQLLHVAIIMDGNGRWAQARGWPRLAGHRAGAEALRRAVEAAPHLGIGTLTVYAFSSDNWGRPAAEVRALMRLFLDHLHSETPKLVEHGIRLAVIGRRDRLSAPLVAAIRQAEFATACGANLHLRLAIDYSARDSILRAAARLPKSGALSRERFATLLGEVTHAGEPARDVDLLVRTAGEQRLSDFMLWECAYAEFVFTPRLWPDFGRADLEAAVQDFHSRERRFGGLPAAAAV